MKETPVAKGGRTTVSRAMQGMLARASPDLDLTAADNFSAKAADAFLIERIPVPLEIRRAQNLQTPGRIEFL